MPDEKDPGAGIFDDILSSTEKTITNLLEKAFNTLKNDTVNQLKTLEQSALSVSKAMGQGRETAFEVRQAFTDAYISVQSISDGTKDINKVLEEIQQGALDATGKNVTLNKDLYKDLYASEQVLNTNAETLFTIFKNVGGSLIDVSKEAQGIVDTARDLGVNIQLVFGQVSYHLQELNRLNFQDGVEGLSRMAARAVELRVDMGTTLKFAEQVMNPDKAIEMANAFQRLGVGTSALLDPLKLMDLSMNDPEELQNQLAKMTEQFTRFNQESGRFEILPGAKRTLDQLSKDTGIAYDQLAKMGLAASELQDKMGKIRFPDFVTKDQREMIANMAEFDKKQGQFVITLDQKDDKGNNTQVLKSVTSLNENDIKKLAEMSKPKSLEDLQKGTLTASQNIDNNTKNIFNAISLAAARSETVEKALRGAMGLSENTEESLRKAGLDPKKVQSTVDQMLKEGADFFKNIGNKTGIEKVFKEIGDSMGEYKDAIPKFFKQFGTNFGEGMKTNKNIEYSGIPELIKDIDKLIKQLSGSKQDDFLIKAGGDNVQSLNISPDDHLIGFKDPQSLSAIAEAMISKNDSSIKAGGNEIQSVKPIDNFTGFKDSKSSMQDAMSPKNMVSPDNTSLIEAIKSSMNVKHTEMKKHPEDVVVSGTININITGNNLEDIKRELQRDNSLSQLIIQGVKKSMQNSLMNTIDPSKYAGTPIMSNSTV